MPPKTFMNLLNAKLKQKEKELAIVYEVAQMLVNLDLDSLLKEIVRLATKLTNADSCLVYLLDESEKTLVLRASKNPHTNVLGTIKMKLGEGITGWVAKEQEVVVIERDADKDPRFKFFSTLPEDQYEAFLSVPILNRKGTVGVINIQHKKSQVYEKGTVELLKVVGKLVGGAVDNARLLEESLALKDALATRKLLEKAKAILMKSGLTEDDAHRRIQKQSMNQGKSVRDVCNAIIMAFDVLKQ